MWLLLEFLLDGGGEVGGDVGTLGGDVKDGQTGGGQGGVNKGVAVTPGFFFVGGIVEFDDQDRAEFVAGVFSHGCTRMFTDAVEPSRTERSPTTR